MNGSVRWNKKSAHMEIWKPFKKSVRATRICEIPANFNCCLIHIICNMALFAPNPAFLHTFHWIIIADTDECILNYVYTLVYTYKIHAAILQQQCMPWKIMLNIALYRKWAPTWPYNSAGKREPQRQRPRVCVHCSLSDEFHSEKCQYLGRWYDVDLNTKFAPRRVSLLKLCKSFLTFFCWVLISGCHRRFGVARVCVCVCSGFENAVAGACELVESVNSIGLN